MIGIKKTVKLRQYAERKNTHKQQQMTMNNIKEEIQNHGFYMAQRTVTIGKQLML